MKKRPGKPLITAAKSIEIDSKPAAAPNETALAERGDEQTNAGIMSAVREQWRRFDWSLVGMILAVKAVIFVFGVQSYLTLMNKPLENWYGWLEIWNRWDSLRYIRLAQIGYKGVGSERADLVGFPLYPWLVRLFAVVFQDYLISAFVVSILALIAAGLLLHKLVLADF